MSLKHISLTDKLSSIISFLRQQMHSLKLKHLLNKCEQVVGDWLCWKHLFWLPSDPRLLGNNYILFFVFGTRWRSLKLLHSSTSSSIPVIHVNKRTQWHQEVLYSDNTFILMLEDEEKNPWFTWRRDTVQTSWLTYNQNADENFYSTPALRYTLGVLYLLQSL